MSNLLLWIPELFDPLYRGYLSKNKRRKIAEPFLIDRLVSEKDVLLLIPSESEYNLEIEKWRPLKAVVDTIHKKLSPFKKEQQIIDIDISQIDVPEDLLSAVLMSLVYERVCKWEYSDSPVPVISNINVLKYLKGRGIIIQDYQSFSNFRKEINSFYNFIEQQKLTKFSSVETVPSKQQTETKSQKPKSKFIKIFLTKYGELFREPKTKYCYIMGEKSGRHQIVRLLVENTGYQETQSIVSMFTGLKTEQTVRTEIGKINVNTKNKLKCNNFLQGKKGSGYRINPKYKVMMKDE